MPCSFNQSIRIVLVESGIGFPDFRVDFWISEWISGFQIGFLDFWISQWISGFHSGFLDFSLDFWISGFQFGFLQTVYEISFVTDPSLAAEAVRSAHAQ